jgi:tetratricopeptide (TPR) repeat protein
MASDVVDYDPDLIIVYDGHNEFYGALGISSNESPGKSRWMNRLYLRLLRARTFLLLRDLYGSVVSLMHDERGELSRGTMMEKLAYGKYIPYGSQTYRDALSMFEGNLKELKGLCARHRIPLILATQVSNLRDRSPFISGSVPGTTPDERLRFNDRINLGLTNFMEGRFSSALASFRAVLPLDTLRAETHFLIARCLDSLDERSAALIEYRKARDYDQLRFRTSTEFNDAILSMGDTSGTFVLDMERVFAAHSPDSLIGNTLITEHLHPNTAGYFLMGKAYAEMMRTHGLLASREVWSARDTIPDATFWHEREVTTLDERLAQRRTDILTSGWPFRDQVPTVKAIARNDTLGQIIERVTRGLCDWKTAHEEAAAYFERRGQLDSTVREQKVIISQIPLDVHAYLDLAHVYLVKGDLSDMAAVLRASQSVQPTILAARALGDFALQSGNAQEAVAQYESMTRFTQSIPEQVENGYLLALAYQRAGMSDRARQQLLKILKLRPDYKPATDLLARMSEQSFKE